MAGYLTLSGYRRKNHTTRSTKVIQQYLSTMAIELYHTSFNHTSYTLA